MSKKSVKINLAAFDKLIKNAKAEVDLAEENTIDHIIKVNTVSLLESVDKLIDRKPDEVESVEGEEPKEIKKSNKKAK